MDRPEVVKRKEEGFKIFSLILLNLQLAKLRKQNFIKRCIFQARFRKAKRLKKNGLHNTYDHFVGLNEMVETSPERHIIMFVRVD